MSEFSILREVLDGVKSNREIIQCIKGEQEENESSKIFGDAKNPVIAPEDDRPVRYKIMKNNKQYAGIVAEGSTEYARGEVGEYEEISQASVKIGAETVYTAEDEYKLQMAKARLSNLGSDADYLALLQELEFDKKPSDIYKRIYNSQDLACWMGSANEETYRTNGKNKSTSYALTSAKDGEAYGVLNNPYIRGTSDARVLTPDATNSKTKWSEKYAETGGSESIIGDIVKMYNALSDDLVGSGYTDNQKILVLPRKLVVFLKQKPYDQTNNLGRKLFDEVITRIGFTAEQVMESNTLDQFTSMKEYGIMMVKDNNMFGCLNSVAKPLQDQIIKDTLIISANARTAGFKCAFPKGIRLIKGLA